MKPEHEEFLLDHLKKMGFIFIIDRLKQQFPTLSHDDACAIYKEFRAKHADNPTAKKADSQIKNMGEKIGVEIEKMLKDSFGHEENRDETAV